MGSCTDIEEDAEEKAEAWHMLFRSFGIRTLVRFLCRNYGAYPACLLHLLLRSLHRRSTLHYRIVPAIWRAWSQDAYSMPSVGGCANIQHPHSPLAAKADNEEPQDRQMILWTKSIVARSFISYTLNIETGEKVLEMYSI